jgi:hypothetical protein
MICLQGRENHSLKLKVEQLDPEQRMAEMKAQVATSITTEQMMQEQVEVQLKAQLKRPKPRRKRSSTNGRGSGSDHDSDQQQLEVPAPGAVLREHCITHNTMSSHYGFYNLVLYMYALMIIAPPMTVKIATSLQRHD